MAFNKNLRLSADFCMISRRLLIKAIVFTRTSAEMDEGGREGA